MNRKTVIRSRATAFALATIICGSGLTACSKQTESPTVLQETIASTEAAKEIIVGNIRCDSSTRDLTVSDADVTELQEVLSRLPQLENLILKGRTPKIQELLALQKQFPQLRFVLEIEINSKTVSTNAEHLDLTNSNTSPEELVEILPLFANLKELTLIGTNLTDEENMAIADSLPGVLVRCELPMAGQRFLTDSTEISIANTPVTVEEVEQMLPYFPRLEKLDMSFCGISDEEMDALNQRHPKTSIVWTLIIGEVKTRTDAIYFYPAESNYYPTNAEMTKLRYCPDLIAVDIGHTRATDCEFLWYTPKVKYLILADTGITDITPVGNLKELIYLELFNLKTKDYSPLLNCTKLQDLNIGTTHADPEPLSKMTWLHNLQWHRADHNPETREAVLKLPEQLPDTNVVLYPRNKARNIGGPWRYIPNYYVFRDIIGAAYFNQDQIGDYWGEVDGDRIMACESGKSFAAYTLAEIIRERIDKGEPIIGIRNVGSEKSEILYQSLLNAEP